MKIEADATSTPLYFFFFLNQFLLQKEVQLQA